jgi:hypothetical protein
MVSAHNNLRGQTIRRKWREGGGGGAGVLLVFKVLPGGVTHRRLRSNEHKILAIDTYLSTL